jgi:acyl dehydratase
MIAAASVGTLAGPLVQTIDARWLMAYAAALGEVDPRYFDTTRPDGPAAHPLFPVCYEWPLLVAVRERAIGDAGRRGVHAAHRLLLHRPVRAGDELTTTARITAVAPRRSGTLVVVRLLTTDGAGRPVTTTDYGSIYRGVATDAVPGPAERPSAAAPSPLVRWSERVDVGPPLAHVYSECARIWNPIHTDLAVAREAGLPGPILHGTATLALAVSRVVARDLGGDPAVARGVSARFSGMVPASARLTVRALERRPDAIAFDAVDAAGAPILSEGRLAT